MQKKNNTENDCVARGRHKKHIRHLFIPCDSQMKEENTRLMHFEQQTCNKYQLI